MLILVKEAVALQVVEVPDMVALLEVGRKV